MANTASAPARGTLSTRPGASRKLLERKQAEQAAERIVPAADALEDSFPASGDGAEQGEPRRAADEDTPPAPDDAVVAPAAEAPAPSPPEPESAPSDAVAAVPAPAALAAPAWSANDESALNAMLARRKAAGFVRRGPDVAGQLLRAGGIKPNPGTVVAVVVALAAEHGPLPRGRLLDLMQAAAFSHPKAKPADRGWCQGYVAGALRDGFLALDEGDASGAADPIESSARVAA